MEGTRSSSKAATCVILFLALEVKELAAGDKPQTDIPPLPGRKIVVSIPERKLVLLEGNEVRKVYRIAVGAPGTPTPTGTCTITTRVPSPNYYKSGKVILPGSTNPVGTRWLGLSLKGYGIHGTNSPASIGKAASHGCIRMRNEDIEQLFELVRTGDVVELHAEADALAQIIGIPALFPQKAASIGADMNNSAVDGTRVQR